MKNIVLSVTLFLFLWMTSVTDLYADSYRCGRKIIRTGDSSADLLRICGKPSYKDRGHETVKLKGQYKETSVERWYYRKSNRSLGRVIIVHRGKIEAIDIVRR